MQPRCATPENVKHVANGGSGLVGHDSNSLRKLWQRAFASGIEKSFGLELAFERFELRLQNAQTAWLKNLDAELILSARFEYRHISINLHLGTIGQWLP